MILDAFVRGPAPDAEAVCAALRSRGLHTAWGPEPEPCRVLLHWGPVEVAGAACLPLDSAATWLPPDLDDEEWLDRIVDAVSALLDLSAPERLVDPEHLARTIAELAQSIAADPEPDPLLLLTGAVERAVQRGAPVHNAGSPDGCAAVYEAAIDALLARLSAMEVPSLVEAMAEELGRVRHLEVPGEERSWTLRNAFDRVLLAYHTTQGMESLDITFESLSLAGRAMSPNLLYDVIGLAIARGAPVFNAGGHEGCARIYLRTAVGILDGLDPDPESDSRSEALARETLTVLVEGAEERLPDQATELAWDLRTALDAIVDVAAEERGWQHDA